MKRHSWKFLKAKKLPSLLPFRKESSWQQWGFGIIMDIEFTIILEWKSLAPNLTVVGSSVEKSAKVEEHQIRPTNIANMSYLLKTEESSNELERMIGLQASWEEHKSRIGSSGILSKIFRDQTRVISNKKK